MRKRFRDTEAWKWIRLLLEIVVMAAMIWGAIRLYTSFGFASAYGDEYYEEAYVLCVPNDVVNVRRKPSRSSEVIGRFETGEKIWLDGKRKSGYLHCVNVSLEEDSGWIHSGYVVYDRPEYVGQNAVIVSKGRLAARKYVGGKRTRWLQPLASVKVWYWSNEWAVTNCGYVKTDYLELEGE